MDNRQTEKHFFTDIMASHYFLGLQNELPTEKLQYFW